jgi:subtilisin-like proprotein convertase family protein
LSKGSSNPVLVPVANIVFGGSGASRTVTVTPAAGQTGTSVITVTVSDGVDSASDLFVLTVSSVVTGTQSFTNATAITISTSFNAPGTPYPSAINVSGLGGTISQVTVTLKGFTHTWPNDVDVLLVGPTGQKVMVMSDAGGGVGVSGLNLTLSDGAAAALSQWAQLTSGTFKPTDYEVGDVVPGPAPAGPYGATLSAFNGLAAGGTWSLYVSDDGAGDGGSFAGGWSLTITTTGPGPSGVFMGTAPRITALEIDGEGGVVLSVSGEVGRSYALEGSPDLRQWTSIGVQDNTTGLVVFREPAAGHANRFYRAVAGPRSSMKNQ